MHWLYYVFYAALTIALFPYVVGLFLPRRYVVTREVVVKKPAREVFDFMKLLKNQERYSTYAQADPAMKIQYAGTDGTPGATVSWDSKDKNVGKSEQEIKTLEDGRKIEIEIRFERPFQSTDPLLTEIEAIDANTSRIRNTYRSKIRYPYNLLVWWVMAKVRENMQASLDNAKSVLEGKEAKA
ncbi:MAG: SRPBCC family protein [Xanthobacteraceae bacterium]